MGLWPSIHGLQPHSFGSCVDVGALELLVLYIGTDDDGVSGSLDEMDVLGAVEVDGDVDVGGPVDVDGTSLDGVGTVVAQLQ